MTGLNKHTGTAVTSTDAHIRQAINDILTTPVGSRVMRRDYGSVLPDLIDQPLNEKTILRLYAATAAAVMYWEPRFKITLISLSFTKNGTATVEISGSIGTQSLTFNTSVQGVL